MNHSNYASLAAAQNQNQSHYLHRSVGIVVETAVGVDFAEVQAGSMARHYKSLRRCMLVQRMRFLD